MGAMMRAMTGKENFLVLRRYRTGKIRVKIPVIRVKERKRAGIEANKYFF